MSDAAVIAGTLPSGAEGGARGLHQRLQTAFRSNVVPPEARDDAFLRLRADLAAGRLGGLPLKGEATEALLILLDQLGWTVNVGRLARAMPHFPESFGIVEVRACLARLGYVSTLKRLRPEAISPAQLPAVIVDAGRIFILAFDEDGRIGRIDLQSGERRTIGKGSAEVISFAPRVDDAGGASSQGSWLASIVRRFQPEVIKLFWLTTVINVMVLAVAFAVISIYDKVIPAGAYDTLAAICIGIGIAVFVEIRMRRLKAELIGRVTGRLEYLLGTGLFSKLVSLPLHMVSNTPVGDQIARLRQFEIVRDLFAGPFVAIGLELPFVVVFLVALFFIAGPLGFVPLVLVAAYAVLGALLVGPVQRQNQVSARHRREYHQSALETISNLRYLRGLGCEDIWLQRLDRKVAESAAARRRAGASQRLLATVSQAAIPLSGAAMVGVGALLVMEEALTVGVLIGAMIVAWRVLAPIQQVFLMLSRYAEMAQTASQLDQMMRLPSQEEGEDIHVSRTLSGAVAFDRVTFRYPGAAQAALQGLTFDIEPGAFVAIEGHSGAGKSTVLRLLLDLQQPLAGSVKIDGINVRQIPDTDLKAAIGYVPQYPVLFHGSIAQNLRLSVPGATDDQLRGICNEIGILAAIEQLPKGLDTLLDHLQQERLPGGFRQAMSVAQALLRQPRILLMDDPAKTLDHDLEEAFLAAIGRRRGRTTIIMVSHRPSHIRLADRVLRLSGGQMVSFDAPKQGG